jgi:hypothetical protein
MNNSLYEDLLESIQEAGQIQRGEKPASRTFHCDTLDTKKVVINGLDNRFHLTNKAIIRYFEILAEQNPDLPIKHSYNFYENLEDLENKVKLGDNTSKYQPNDINKMLLVTHFFNGKEWHSCHVNRECPALVRLVEETKGNCVEEGLAFIIEVPQDLIYDIDETYRGDAECIYERHRIYYYNKFTERQFNFASNSRLIDFME